MKTLALAVGPVPKSEFLLAMEKQAETLLAELEKTRARSTNRIAERTALSARLTASACARMEAIDVTIISAWLVGRVSAPILQRDDILIGDKFVYWPKEKD